MRTGQSPVKLLYITYGAVVHLFDDIAGFQTGNFRRTGRIDGGDDDSSRFCWNSQMIGDCRGKVLYLDIMKYRIAFIGGGGVGFLRSTCLIRKVEAEDEPLPCCGTRAAKNMPKTSIPRIGNQNLIPSPEVHLVIHPCGNLKK